MLRAGSEGRRYVQNQLLPFSRQTSINAQKCEDWRGGHGEEVQTDDAPRPAARAAAMP
ncbi:hypothetical protein SBA2_70009 [Acidobacteriia bacterium SbA2]|nr:hypothetical protein SBA2_70009 [Acidobacteriia bacterium SbA2]